ncbi:MAG: polysaccharide biosynthesis C-terminal domain-containing protein [Candidatus Omnitrophica bacterium]|nr:polysaccharide biosynthesis C-terminal domain-containing protein [Candidatus Omnitrophota bacterium]
MDISVFKDKIIKNTLFNMLGRVWMVLVTIFLTPYIINHVGVERYGIWVIIGVVTGYFGLLDLGLGMSFVKFISENFAKREFGKLNEVINTGIVFYALFGIFLIAITFFIVKPLLLLLNVPDHLIGEATFVFILGIMIFAFSCMVSPIMEIQRGIQRMDISNIISISVSIPMIIGTIFVIERGYGLRGLIINNAFILTLGTVVNIIAAFQLLPTLRISPLLSSVSTFKRLITFGYKVQIAKIASMFHFQLDRIILASFLNIGLVTYYSVAAQLASRIRDIPVLLISAIFPAASELEANKDTQSLQRLFLRSLKYVVIAGLPLLFLVLLLAKPFITLWLGSGYERSIATLQVLMFVYFFNVLTGPGYHILNGMGKPQYTMRSSTLGIVLNLLLTILLVIKMGYYGVVLGTAIALIVSAAYFNSMSYRVLQISFRTVFIKILYRPLLACVISYGIMYIVLKQVPQIGWFALCGSACAYLISFSLITLKLDYLDEFDKVLINKYISFLHV